MLDVILVVFAVVCFGLAVGLRAGRVSLFALGLLAWVLIALALL